MAMTAAGLRLTRSVPCPRTVDGTAYRLGIAAIHDDGRVAVQVMAPGTPPHRAELVVGDVLELGSERWRLSAIHEGDRGTLDFVPASDPA